MLLENLPPLLRARAEIVVGNAAASSPLRNFERAIEHHLMAIRLASQLESSPEISLRRAALRVLVQAHLACALDVARGNWQRKSDVVPKWLASAREISVRVLQETNGSPLIELQIHATALAVARERADAEGIAIDLHQLDVLQDPLPEVDVVTCALFLHHLEEAQVVHLLQRMTAAARRLVVVSPMSHDHHRDQRQEIRETLECCVTAISV